MTTTMKPSAPPVGRIYEDRLSTDELRALLDVEGADDPVGTSEEVLAHLDQAVHEIAGRKSRG